MYYPYVCVWNTVVWVIHWVMVCIVRVKSVCIVFWRGFKSFLLGWRYRSVSCRPGRASPCSSSSTKEQSLKAEVVYVACINTHSRCSYIYSFIHSILYTNSSQCFGIYSSCCDCHLIHRMSIRRWTRYIHTYIHIVDCLYVFSSLRILCMYEYRIYIDNIQTHNHMNIFSRSVWIILGIW